MYKLLNDSDISIKPFKVYKEFTLTTSDSGSFCYGLEGLSGSTHNFVTESAASQSFGVYNSLSASLGLEPYSLGTFYKLPTFHSVKKMYYSNLDKPYLNFGGNDTNTEKREIHNRVNVISVPKNFYGERIKKKSIKLTDDSKDTTLTIVDDGYGNLYDFQYSQSYANYFSHSFDSTYLDANGSGSVLGNVFYSHGVLAFTNTGSMYNGIGVGSGSDGFSLKFKAEHTIYEHEYVCTVMPNEFTHTKNISVSYQRSGSITVYTSSLDGTDSIQINKYFPPGDNPTNGTGSFKPYYEATDRFESFVTHSDFSPYVSTVGLYNDFNELLAIGKLSHPIKNDPELTLSIVVRFDV